MAEICNRRTGTATRSLTFSQHLACTHCGLSFEELAPRNFSFNSPYGACPSCDGLGTRYEVDPELVVPDDSKRIAHGAIAPWAGARSGVLQPAAGSRGRHIRLRRHHALGEAPQARTKRSSSPAQVLDHVQLRYNNRFGRQRTFDARYEGVIPWLQRRHSEAETDSFRESIESYMREVPCTGMRRRRV